MGIGQQSRWSTPALALPMVHAFTANFIVLLWMDLEVEMEDLWGKDRVLLSGLLVLGHCRQNGLDGLGLGLGRVNLSKMIFDPTVNVLLFRTQSYHCPNPQRSNSAKMAAIAIGKSLHIFSSKESLSFSPLTITKPKTHHLKFTKTICSPNSHRLRLAIRASSTSSTALNDPPIPTLKSSDHQLRVQILSESLPYIQKFRGKTIVVKYGGAAMKSAELKASVVRDLVLLSCVGLRPVLVHGGGPEINVLLNQLNIPAQFHDGLRVTDAKTMEVVSMVLVGKVNKDLVSRINFAGATAVGLSGMDGRLLTARPSPNAAQLGFVGEVARVDPTVLQPLVDNGHIPVIASVAADEFGQPYNINADTVAGEVAAALGAEKLILLTDVAGILSNREDPGSLVKEIDIKGMKKMIEDGQVGGGMIPKVNCCIRSLAQGVTTASIIDGRVEHSLLQEIMTDEGAGTMITG
ncbi:acetylglutamate kinase, chloroplastic-like [Durio zibethinus]|uniref:acetylglutamate kinase n=1 Tax=Durio zibethinus TaxID=66656 RepID=A0A6P5WRN6_DURZI|nr:acetylglutamate kinase, chloroplastic-like [Durio zibethinus]